MGAPINVAEFKTLWSPMPEEARAIENLLAFFPKPGPYLIVERVYFSELSVLDDILHVDDDEGRKAIEEGLMPFADSSGIAYAVWLKAPKGARPVVAEGKGRDFVVAPSLEAFIELLAIGYSEPYSRNQLAMPPQGEWGMTDLKAFQRHFKTVFKRKSLPKDGSAAMEATKHLQPVFEAWLDKTFTDR